jgi:hypothetical protein
MTERDRDSGRKRDDTGLVGRAGDSAPDDSLRDRVDRLPRELPTARDLWPDVARRVARSSPARRARARFALAGGAALAFAAAASLVLALRGRHAVEPPSGVVASTPAPAPFATAAFPGEREYAAAERALDDELTAHRDAMPAGEAAVIDRNVRIVDDAIAATRAALADHPQDEELRAELDRDWEDKLDLLRDAVELPGGMR